jgi:drug/metabolite transporter (DMT)-like permease
MKKPTHHVDALATLACTGSLLCWSVGPIFIKLLTGFVDCWTQNLLRYSVACVFWLPLLFFFARAGRLDGGVWKRAALPAGVNVVMQSFWAAAFYYINPAFMNLLVKSSVVWIVGFSLLFFSDERGLVKSISFWLGMSLCIIGVFGVLYFKRDFAATGTFTGIIMTLTAAFLWGIYTVTARAAFKNIDSRVSFSVVTIYTVIGLALLAVIFGKPAQSLKMGTKAWIYVIVSGLTAIAFSHVLYYAAMKRIGAAIPSLVLLSSPFVVLSISRIVFGESLNPFQWAFGIILLAGAALAILAQQHLKKDHMTLNN